jgi:hypothetical protein
MQPNRMCRKDPKKVARNPIHIVESFFYLFPFLFILTVLIFWTDPSAVSFLFCGRPVFFLFLFFFVFLFQTSVVSFFVSFSVFFIASFGSRPLLTPRGNAFDKTKRGGLDLEICLTAKLYPFSSLIHCQTVYISFFLACWHVEGHGVRLGCM